MAFSFQSASTSSNSAFGASNSTSQNSFGFSSSAPSNNTSSSTFNFSQTTNASTPLNQPSQPPFGASNNSSTPSTNSSTNFFISAPSTTASTPFTGFGASSTQPTSQATPAATNSFGFGSTSGNTSSTTNQPNSFGFNATTNNNAGFNAVPSGQATNAADSRINRQNPKYSELTAIQRQDLKDLIDTLFRDWKKPTREGLDYLKAAQSLKFSDMERDINKIKLNSLKVHNLLTRIKQETEGFREISKDLHRDAQLHGNVGWQQIEWRGKSLVYRNSIFKLSIL